MFDIYFLLVIIIAFCFFGFLRYMRPIEISLAYAITQKYVQQLTNLYLNSNVFPYMLIPKNEFTADELKMHRNECIKFVLSHIKQLPIYKLISLVYDDELIALMVDNEFVSKTTFR